MHGPLLYQGAGISLRLRISPRTPQAPMIIVTNNGWGISTPGNEQHGEKHVADRGKAMLLET